MDTARQAALGITPIQDELRRVDAIRGTRDLYEYFGRAARMGVDFADLDRDGHYRAGRGPTPRRSFQTTPACP